MSYYSTQIRDGFGREIRVSKESAPIAKNAGLLAISTCLDRIRFLSTFETYISDSISSIRKPTSSRENQYTNMDLIRQRFFALMAGYEDLNDHDALSQEEGFRLTLGSKVASSTTLCRFERSITEQTINKGNEFLRDFYLKHGPRKKVVIIDVDNTPVETFGFQESQYFNGHYNCKCYLPLLAFIDGYPVGVYNGTTDGRKKMLEVLQPLVTAIRKRRPNTVILLRADSGFNSTALIELCEELNIYYVIGLAKNKNLLKRLEQWQPESIKILQQPNDIGSVLAHIGEIQDYQAKGWKEPRRIIVRDYWNDQRREWDVRFIQTNIPKEDNQKCADLWKKDAVYLYNLVYCQRCLAEQYNQEFKAQAFGQRVSSSRYLTNSYRMLLAALCQAAFRFLRTKYFRKGTSWHTATLSKFRRECVQVPAFVIKQSKRFVTLAFPKTSLNSHCLQRLLSLEG